MLQQIRIGFTFLVLPFLCRLTRIVLDRIQEVCKMVVCVCVYSFVIDIGMHDILVDYLCYYKVFC